MSRLGSFLRRDPKCPGLGLSSGGTATARAGHAKANPSRTAALQE